MIYEERFYRQSIKPEGLATFKVAEKQTDLLISAEKDLTQKALELVLKYRKILEDYIKSDSQFKETLEPYKVSRSSPKIVKEMAKAASMVGVGPMAAVAGAFAQFVGQELLKYSKEVIVENGGDDFIASRKERIVAIFAGRSPLNMKLGIKINPKNTPLGVCTSSGTIGPSLSFGKADAVTVVSKSTLLADAAATAIGNLVKTESDIEKGINFAKAIKDIKGVVIIVGDKMGVGGDIEIVNIV